FLFSTGPRDPAPVRARCGIFPRSAGLRDTCAVVTRRPIWLISRNGGRTGGARMEYFLQQLINGMTLGAIYGLIAIGYTMVYGIIGMINFAHGDIFMVGAFIALMMFVAL